MEFAWIVASNRVLLEGMSKAWYSYDMSNPSQPTRLHRTDLESYIRSIDAKRYFGTRNYIGGSTRLSEYITRGAISLPEVRDLILEQNSKSDAWKLLNELTWREYWQLAWTVRGDGIFEYIRPLPEAPRSGIPQAILDATTGITALDDGIRQLYQTGYIDNHMRMWLAGLICNVAHCDWKIGAEWMHSYLVDGDFASNHLSWQWVAGSYTGKPYLPQQENINKYTKSSQTGSYLDQPYSRIAAIETPPELLELRADLPAHDSKLPSSTITTAELGSSGEILLYSPWTLDPLWRSGSSAARVLLIDTELYSTGRFDQNVIDSIMWFAAQIPDLQVLRATPDVLQSLSKKIIRKSYPGIANWPGQIDEPQLLHPDVPAKFYPSFSAYWKQVKSE